VRLVSGEGALVAGNKLNAPPTSLFLSAAIGDGVDARGTRSSLAPRPAVSWSIGTGWTWLVPIWGWAERRFGHGVVQRRNDRLRRRSAVLAHRSPVRDRELVLLTLTCHLPIEMLREKNGR